MNYNLSFIKKEDFYKHVENTIINYGDNLKPLSLDAFNRNIVDPIKLIFDKTVYNFTYEDIIKNEIFRQRDKSNNNNIGYFHQKIFSYIKNCKTPNKGWDIIVENKNGLNIFDDELVSKVFVELKNKHNTMNSSSSAKTYMKMQSQLLKDDSCACFLVEVIAKKSQNISWEISLDGVKNKHKLIRRVSVDKFYELITGESNAFYKICEILPHVVEEVVLKMGSHKIYNDTVIEELKEDNMPFHMALYMLGFKTYLGFSDDLDLTKK